MVTQAKVCRFIHKTSKLQTYWIGERDIKMGNRMVKEPVKACFEDGQFSTSDPEIIEFLRSHKDFNVKMVEIAGTDGELSEEMQLSHEAFQAALTKTKKRKKREPLAVA